MFPWFLPLLINQTHHISTFGDRLRLSDAENKLARLERENARLKAELAAKPKPPPLPPKPMGSFKHPELVVMKEGKVAARVPARLRRTVQDGKVSYVAEAPPPYQLPSVQKTVDFLAQIPPTSVKVVVDVPIKDVDSLYAAAGLSEEDEWDIRRHIATARKKLEAL